MAQHVHDWQKERAALNELVLERDDLNIKRFFGIDSAVYRDGALDARTKEMLGLVASLVLRCDDCITYHIIQVRKLGLTDAQFDELISVGLIVGGSITIPHIRRAYRTWQQLGVEGQT